MFSNDNKMSLEFHTQIHQIQVDGGINRFCVITLSGYGIKVNKDFYVKGTFTTTAMIGPYGGISFNMQGTENGNYVMMRLLVSNFSHYHNYKTIQFIVLLHFV